MYVLYIAIAAVFIGLIIFSIIWLLSRRRRLLDKYYQTEADWLVAATKQCNCIFYGLKGSGKDATMCYATALRGELHYSDIYYGPLTELIDLAELNAGGNKYKDLITGTVRKFPPRFVEGCDIWLSDVGIKLPSQYNGTLDDLYPSMPVFFAVQRHLYDSNTHCNTQELGRPWNKLREQAGYFIWCRGAVRRGKYLYVNCVSYNKYSSADKQVLPPVGHSGRDLEQFNATYGEILEHNFMIPLRMLTYDSRYYKNVFLDFNCKEVDDELEESS